MHQRKHLVFSSVFFAFLLQVLLVSAFNNVTFDFPYFFDLRNLTLLGDSHLRNGVIGLTRELGVPSSSAGSVIYNNPVSFFDKESNTTASFATRFSFSINNMNPTSFGDGFVFFISPDNQTLGSFGGYLGLVNSSHLIKNKFVAIEFDTRLDTRFNDPDENHVGLDIDSLNSIRTADPTSIGIDLKSGNLITAWVDYKHDSRVLRVFLSYSSFKPEQPILSVDIDLSGYLGESMYVGFSGSTEGSTELHWIESWKFGTIGFLPVKPRSHPHNVSDSSVNLMPNIPVSNSTNRHRKRLGLGLGIAGPAFFCVFLVAFGYFSAKKWQSSRTEKNIKAEMILNGEAEPMAVPKTKPTLTFSSGLSLTVEDIVSDYNWAPRSIRDCVRN
ncbi:Concanavalin A-like lectin protein kinase family protein [Tripterygium wilfordii]|uniref:Concanavalin A-like lectin protein kinase family protein n=1 Tax=Tripterygium wilfordii TaxID=458696 RepID=A0A7J7C1B0_TRIWF|nr:Concanavalin A-like lectin protein kinase family protein [Tripterygium wilfordii]